ncbi:hypothetical protein B0T17DRAFT_621611 [Bombardia bombarda]|uniref:Aminoglycoside phosphotransferase domain-containing protein n=1 Tax=Bombardia bombarda TaxID=252184 RepID=A0AA39W3S8_9PEZI|nr:hypothetical protein B0T17DRAFT_621611 [Bombardia bombarda]
MSQPFSAGQYWMCLEIIAEDGSLVIARVRLPRHPDTAPTISQADEEYAIACEVATMNFVKRNLPTIRIPAVYAYEGPGSQLATDVGAVYMLLEGFYGNTLQDVKFDMCDLPVATQEHIITQWTKVQAEIASLAYSHIGSTSSISAAGEPVIGRLATASAEGLKSHGPFSTSVEYFTAVADAAVDNLKLSATDSKDVATFATLGTLVFRDIVRITTLFHDIDLHGRFPLNHMDLGAQNILVDDEFNIQAIIDWEFAQTAPWQVNHYPFPFPRLSTDDRIKEILGNPDDVAHKNVLRQIFAQRSYVDKFRDAEAELEKRGQALGGSFAAIMESPASRIYGYFAQLGRMPDSDISFVREMVRLAFGLDAAGTERYLGEMQDKLGAK